MFNLKNKKIVQRFISLGLTSSIVLGIFSSNCFAMRGMGGLGLLDKPRHVIGPPRPLAPVRHLTEKVEKSSICSISKSWIQLGMIAANVSCGSSIVRRVVPVVLGQKGKAAIISAIVKAYSHIPGIEKAASKAVLALDIAANVDDLNKHGVKFTFCIVHKRTVECYCPKGKDHDMVHCEPIVKLECSLY